MINYSIEIKTTDTSYGNIITKTVNDKHASLVSNDTIFTVIVTISIFVIGIGINRWLKLIDKNKSKKELRKHFLFFHNKIKDKLLPYLTSGYKEFYQNTNIDTGFPKTPPKLLTGDFKRLSSMDTKELLIAFDYNEDISRIQSLVDFIENLIILNEKYHDSILIDSNNYRTKLAIHTEEYFHLLAEYCEYERLHTPQYQDDIVWKLITKSIFKYYNEFAGKRALTKFYKQILRPIQDLLIETDYFRNKPLANKITLLGKEMSHIYNDLRSLTFEVRCEYRKYYKMLKDTNEKLIECKINTGGNTS